MENSFRSDRMNIEDRNTWRHQSINLINKNVGILSEKLGINHLEWNYC
jgi:hypothetical protein